MVNARNGVAGEATTSLGGTVDSEAQARARIGHEKRCAQFARLLISQFGGDLAAGARSILMAGEAGKWVEAPGWEEHLVSGGLVEIELQWAQAEWSGLVLAYRKSGVLSRGVRGQQWLEVRNSAWGMHSSYGCVGQIDACTVSEFFSQRVLSGQGSLINARKILGRGWFPGVEKIEGSCAVN